MDCRLWLLRLAFNRSEAAKILASITQNSNPDSLQVGALYRRLAEAAQSGPESCAAVYGALSQKLEPMAPFNGKARMSDIADLWSRKRENLDGLSAAAILWSVARTSASSWRLLEAKIVEDLKYLSARSFINNATANAFSSAMQPMQEAVG